MPPKKGNNTKRGRRRRRPRNGRRRARPRPKQVRASKYAKMLADPCNATLVPGLHGESEGLLASLRQTVDNSASSQHGYFLWCPRYHNGYMETDQGRGCLFGFAAQDSSDRPVNDTNLGSYFGQAGSFTQGLPASAAASFDDPAHALVSQGLVQDARLISACMRLTYYGRLDRSAGQVAYIENVPLAALVGSEGNGPTLSVDDCFRMSTSVQRLGVDTLEIVHRPDPELAGLFHDENDSGLDTSALGAANTYSHLGLSAQSTQPHVFGFAWRNLDISGNTPQAQLTFDLYKNIEWRPTPASGLTSVMPKAIASQDNLHKAMAFLDKAEPMWTKRIIDSASSMAAKVVTMAATGVAQAAFRGDLAAMLL